MKRLSDDLLELMAAALGLGGSADAVDANPFRGLASNPTWTSNINHYPPLHDVGAPEPGQFRIGPHTDFGTVTILDREPGAGGLQVYSDDGGWADAPWDPEALTVNIGDILEYWSAGRWPAGRHRVLPPQPDAPAEDLVSLIYFYELDHDATVVPVSSPIGRRSGLPRWSLGTSSNNAWTRSPSGELGRVDQAASRMTPMWRTVPEMPGICLTGVQVRMPSVLSEYRYRPFR